MRTLSCLLMGTCCLSVLFRFISLSPPSGDVDPALGYFKTNSAEFAVAAAELQAAIADMSPRKPETISGCRPFRPSGAGARMACGKKRRLPLILSQL
jgi:hypothetical protein